MSLKLEQKLKLKQELKLELRQELKQELVLQLKLVIPEFTDLITFDDDEDLDLLRESFPFMMLHEVNHPLQSKGILKMPEIKCAEEFFYNLDNSTHFRAFDHQASEVNVDKGAILNGYKTCNYSVQYLLNSHAAITERVFRDMFETENLPVDYSFIARLDSELRTHYNKAKNSELKSRIENLIVKTEEHVETEFSDCKDLYEEVVKVYSKIYTGTKI